MSEGRRLGDYLFESWAVNVIIFLNLFVFVLMHFVPTDIEHVRSLILSPNNLSQGNYFSLLTSGFIHRDFSHFFLNMFGVFIFGRIVERAFGFFKTFFIFLGAQVLSLYLAALLYDLVFGVNMHIIGASGGLMGLIGCAMLADPFYVTYEMIFPLPVMFKGWMFIFADLQGLLSGEKDGVSHLTHLCGFFSVALLVYLLNKQERRTMKQGLTINIFFLLMFLGLNWWMSWR